MVFGILLAGIIGGSIGGMIEGGTNSAWKQNADDEINQEQFLRLIDDVNQSVSSLSSLGSLNSTWSKKMQNELSQIEDHQLEQEKEELSQYSMIQDHIEEFIDNIIDGNRAKVFDFLNTNIDHYKNILYHPSDQAHGGSALIRLYGSIERHSSIVLRLITKIIDAKESGASEKEVNDLIDEYDSKFTDFLNIIVISYVLRGWNGINNIEKNPQDFKAIQNHETKIPTELIFKNLMEFVNRHKKAPYDFMVKGDKFGNIKIDDKMFTRTNIICLIVHFLQTTALMDKNLSRSYLVDGQMMHFPLPVEFAQVAGYIENVFNETSTKLESLNLSFNINDLLPKIFISGKRFVL